MRPRPLSHKWEGETVAKGPRMGNRYGGVDRGHRSPPSDAQGTRGRGPALTHPRTDSSPGTDGSGGAHAQRRGASAKCRGEKRPPTSKRAQRQRREKSRIWMAERAETRALARSGTAGPGAPLPGAQVRPAVCAEVGTALAR